MAKVAQAGNSTPKPTAGVNTAANRQVAVPANTTIQSTPAKVTPAKKTPTKTEVQQRQNTVRNRQEAKIGQPITKEEKPAVNVTATPSVTQSQIQARNQTMQQRQQAKVDLPGMTEFRQEQKDAAAKYIQALKDNQTRRDNLTRDLLGDSAYTMSVTDLYLGASGHAGESGGHVSDSLLRMSHQLNAMYRDEVEPAWNAYQEALSAYNAGTLDYDSAVKALNDYKRVFAQYDPLQKAVEAMKASGGAFMPDGVDLDAATDILNYWDASVNAAEKRLISMGGMLGKLQQSYNVALAEYKSNPNKANADKINDLVDRIQKMSGEYETAMFVFNEMGGDYNKMVGLYDDARVRYYEANPQILRDDDTANSIHERFTPVAEEYERLSREFKEAQDAVIADIGSNGMLSDPELELRMNELQKQLNELAPTYSALAWLDNWAKDPESFKSKAEWERNGWTWAGQYELYKEALANVDAAVDAETRAEAKEEATMLLDRLTTGYGIFLANPEETAELVEDLRVQFDRTVDQLRLSPDVDYQSTQEIYREDPELLAQYKDLQERLHNFGQVATRTEDVTRATAMMVATDVGSLLRIATDFLKVVNDKGSELAGKVGLTNTAEMLSDIGGALGAWSGIMRSDRRRAQEAMQNVTAGMRQGEALAINMLPSVIECIGTLGLAYWAHGAAAAAGITKLPGMAYAEGMAGSLAYASRLANVANVSQELLLTSEYAFQSIISNPQFWSSFARVAGTDYVDSLEKLADPKTGEYTLDDMTRALAYATVNGSLNALVEVGGISEAGGLQSMPFRETAEKAATRKEAWTKALKKLFLETSKEEGWEEVNQGIIERALQVAMLGEDMKFASVDDTEAIFSLLQGLQEFAGGYAISVLVGGAGSIREAYNGGNWADYIQKLNLANLALPEDLRSETKLDATTCTELEAAQFEIQLGISRFIDSVLTEAEFRNAINAGSEKTVARENYVQNLYEKAKQENPGATILDTVSTELQEKGYGDARGARVQGELIGKILSGETLTKEELSVLELNNPIVRGVFIDRTGLSGMPRSVDINTKTKSTYVEAAVKMAQRVKANQKAITEGSTQLLEAQQKRAGEQLDETLNRSKNPIKRRKENIGARSNKAGSTFDSRVEYLHRNDPVGALESGDAESIVSEVRQRASVPDLMTRSEFAESPEYQEQTGEGLDNAYIMYLTDAGLSPAEVNAMIAASDITERSATNERGRTGEVLGQPGSDVRRGTGGRELSDDELGRAGTVRETEERSAGKEEKVKRGEWGSPRAIGIPRGTIDGSQVRELTTEEVKNNPGFVNILEIAKLYGVSPDHVHFIQTKNGCFEVSTKSGPISIRGLHSSFTQEIWVATNNRHYSALQIFGHELMHHICDVCPELVDQVEGLVKDAGLWPEIERHIKARSLKEYRSKGERGIFIEMLCDANGMMHRSYLQGDYDLAKQLRMAVSLYLCTAPDDMIAAAPEVREKMQLDAELFLKNTKQNPDAGIHYSAIDITNDRRDSHHDNLGRQLSKLMDKYMANSYMRKDLKKFMPLTTMYRGATMRREIMGAADPSTDPVYLVFWTDRPDIARTYTEGKGQSPLTHGQEHTKARKRIRELGSEYARIKRTNYSNLPEDQIEEAQRRDRKRMREIDKELEKLRAEVEPFSKDIYAPQKDKNVWPEKPTTYEEAEALINRFGAYNRKASLVKLDGNKLVSEKAVPLFEEAKKRLARMVKFFEDYTAAQEEAGEEPEPEDLLGAPPWTEEEPSNGLPAWANIGIPGFFKPGHEPVKVSSDEQARNSIIEDAKGILDEINSVQDTEDLNALYDAFDSLCGITDSIVTEFLIDYDERSDKAADIRSAYFKDANKDSFRWSDIETMAAAIYNQVYTNTNQNIALDVKGLGVKKVFTSEKAVIEFAQDLVTQLGNKGIYSCYLNITKPLIIDCKGLDWALLNMLGNKAVLEVAAWKVGAESIEDMTMSEIATTDVGTDDIGMWAALQVDRNGNQKYDGVILTNIVDTYGIDNTFNFIGSGAGTVAITWNANTAKSTANATPTNDPRLSYSEEDLERSNPYGEERDGRSVSGTAEERRNGVNDTGPDSREQGRNRGGETGSRAGVSGNAEEEQPGALGEVDEETRLQGDVTEQVSDKWKELKDLCDEVINDPFNEAGTVVNGGMFGSSESLGISYGDDSDMLWRVPLSVAKKYVPATVSDLLERAKEAGFAVFSKINFVWSYSDDKRIHIVLEDGSISSCAGCFDKNTGEIFVVLNNAIPKFASYSLTVQQAFVHELFHRMSYDMDGFVDNMLWNLNRRYDKEAESFKKLLEKSKAYFRDNVPAYRNLSSSELSEEVLAEIYSGSMALIWAANDEDLTVLYSIAEKFRRYIEGFADRNYGTHYSEEDEDQLSMYDLFPIDISAFDGYTTDSVSPIQRERALKFWCAQADKYAKMNGKEFNLAEYIKATNLRNARAKVQALASGSSYAVNVFSELKSYFDKEAAKAARAEARITKQKQKEFDESPEGKTKRAADEKKRKEREEAEARRVQGVKDAVNKAAGKISTPGQKAIVKVLTDALITSGATTDNIEGNFLNRPGIASAIGGIMASDIHAIGATPQWFVDFIGLLDAELGINTNHLLSAATKAGVDIYGDGHAEKNAHGIGIDLAVQLPELINNAIAVFNDKATGNNPYMRDSGEGVVVLTKALRGKEPVVAIISPTTNNEGIVREKGDASNSREVNLYGKKDTVPINQVTTAYSVANFDSYIQKFAAKDPTALWADTQGIEELYNQLGKEVPDFFKNAPHEKENATRFKGAENANRLNLSEEDINDLIRDLEEKLGPDEAKRVKQEFRKLQSELKTKEHEIEVVRERNKATKLVKQTENRAAQKEIKSLTKERDNAVNERDKARESKIKALERANIDTTWKVKMAESKGEQDLIEATRLWRDKFNYANKTNRQWTNGLVGSTRKNTRREERKLAREQRKLDRKVNSLPAKAAVRNRSKFNNRANDVVINDGQALATPIGFKEERTILQKAADFGKWVKDTGSKAYRIITNAVQELDMFAKLQSRMDNVARWVNMVRGAKSTIQQFYEVGMVDRQGNIMGPALNKLLICYDENGNVDETTQKALEQYMFYKHTVDRMSLKARADKKVRDFEAQNAWVTTLDDTEFAREVADGNEKAVEYAKLLLAANEAKDKPVLADADGKPVTAASAQEVVDRFEREMPALVQKAQDIYDWWGVFMLEWAVGTSITEEDFFAMREMYPHYVPTYRVMKHGKHAGGMNAGPDSLTPGVVTKEATGSLRDLEALPDQFVKSMHKIVKMNRQNSLLQNIIEELMFDDDGVFKEYGYFDWDGASEALKQDMWDFAEETDDTCVEKVKIDGHEAYRISCWVNGEKLSAYVNRAMFEGLNFLFDKHSKAYTTAIKIGNALTKPMKMAITGLNLTFAIKNPIRDVQTALVNSIAGPAFGKYLALAGAKMATSDDDWIVFQNLGGVSSEMHYNERGFVKNIAKKDNAWEKTKNVLGTPGEISEAVTRFAEYLATLDMLGGDTFENRVAGIKNAAEVTVDFGRKGSAGAIINSFVPYWNPGLQGLDKAIRSVLEKEGLWGKLKQLGRAGVINVLPKALAMLLTMLAGRWEDWEKLSDQVKDNYICVPIPGDDHKFLKLPISQDWGAYLGGTFTRIVEGVAGRDDPFENFYESALSSTLPFDWLDIGGIKVPFITPIGLDWLMELKENKNYNGSAIVPYDLEDVSPTEQWTSDTTELAYLIAKALHASPIAIDYIIGDYFGNFWGLVPKLVPHGYFTGESTFNDKLQETINSLSTPWIADNRYSSAATASYYDLLDHLKQEVTDAEAHGGNKEDAEHYEFYKALTTNGGFVDQIRELTAQARELPPGDDKDRIRDTIAGLADEALDFYKAWENGEIKDPVHWATYHRYGDKIMEATAALSKYAEDFNFSGALGNPTIIYDRSGEKDVKYRLDDDQQKAYAILRQNNYRDVLNQTISSSQYREADAKGRAALLEAAKTEALKMADKDMLDWLKQNKVTGETITKVDWSYEEKQAAYSISQILGMDNAYDERITDTLIRLYDYTDRYNFTPVESTRKTFISQTDDTQVYELDKTQQAKYSEMYHDIYTDYATKVINSAEFKAASDEEQAVMLQRMRTYVTDKVAEDYNTWLERTGAQSVTRDKASEVMSLEAKYVVQRAIGYDESYPAEITNELIRLYDNRSVGSQSYLPPEYRPTSYTVYDKRGKNTGYKWILNSEQKDMYEAIAQDIYRTDMLRVINSERYQRLDDYGKAQLLCATREQVTGKAKDQFIAWLIQTNAPMTNMNTAEEKERKSDIKAAEKIVEGILK